MPTAILIIEDDADIRELLRFNLEREGFVVLDAEDGERGIALAREHSPRLIMLDHYCPGKANGNRLFS